MYGPSKAARHRSSAVTTTLMTTAHPAPKKANVTNSNAMPTVTNVRENHFPPLVVIFENGA
jgi:hypothetical protein